MQCVIIVCEMLHQTFCKGDLIEKNIIGSQTSKAFICVNPGERDHETHDMHLTKMDASCKMTVAFRHSMVSLYLKQNMG